MKNQFLFKGFLTGGLFLWMLLYGNCQSDNTTGTAPISSVTSDSAWKVQARLTAKHDSIPPETAVDTLKWYTVIGVGDMMLGTNYPSAKYLPPNEGRELLADVNALLQDADVTFGNLEGTILNKGGTPKRCNNPDLCYVFRSPESYGAHFKEAGFDMLSIANNHSGDFGPQGRTRTKEVLKENGIAWAGLAGTDEWCVVERNGKRFGMCAFSPNRGTCSIRDIAGAQRLVRELKEKCDFVIVSFHGGAEGAKNQHVPRQTETYYGENRGNVYTFAHSVIDAGADIVFGHGPHVTRAVELYKDRFIIYSLGNFCTYGRFNLRGPAGVAPLVKVFIDEEGIFQKASVTPVYQHKAHGPKVDPDKEAIRYLQELTAADFPETPLEITDDGWILKQ